MTRSVITRVLVGFAAAVLPMSAAACSGSDHRSSPFQEPLYQQDNGLETVVACGPNISHNGVGFAELSDDAQPSHQRKVLAVKDASMTLASSKDGVSGDETGRSGVVFLTHDGSGTVLTGVQGINQQKKQIIPRMFGDIGYAPGKVAQGDPGAAQKATFVLTPSGDFRQLTFTATMGSADPQKADAFLSVTQTNPPDVSADKELAKRRAILTVNIPEGHVAEVTGGLENSGESSEIYVGDGKNGKYSVELHDTLGDRVTLRVATADETCIVGAERTANVVRGNASETTQGSEASSTIPSSLPRVSR